MKGFPFDRDEEDQAELEAAVRAAAGAEAAVIFAGIPDVIESEGYDRKDMRLPDCQNRLIQEVAKVQPNTIVVLHNGSPIEAPWADRVAAVLEMYLGGQGVGEATDRLLYGEANPSGHLAETFPMHLEDNPSYLNFPGDGLTAEYAEGIYVGYRYYDKKKMPVRWAFGHGLSYTEFAYSNLRMPAEALGDEGSVKVAVDVTNIGGMTGKEVVQLYVSDKNGTFGRPVKELKGFSKVELQPGETRTVEFELTARDLSFYHEGLGDWYAPSGHYEILAGGASDRIALTGTLSFQTRKQIPLHVNGSTTMGELMANPVTAPIVGQMMQGMQNMGGASADTLGNGTEIMQAMMLGMPLKSLASFGGAKGAAQIEQMIQTMNQKLGN